MERALREGYAIIQDTISPGTGAGIMALANERDGWEDVYAHERTDLDEAATEPGRTVLEMDKKRLMRSLPEHIVDDLDDALKEKWCWFYPNHVAKNWVLMKSLPGGQQQAPHTDYNLWGPDSSNRVLTLDYSRVPATLLLAIEPETKLVLYGWNRLVADTDDMVTITLDAGDMLLFLGDMIHAGAAYEKTDVRVHAYLCPQDMTIEPDTYIVPVLQHQLPSVAKCATQGRCVFFNCDYKPKGENKEENLKRHINRTHNVRVSKKVKLIRSED